ncbi:MAG: DinB family protein [Flavobacteriales bacterium]|nr:DinB family protein [Flavobacteriales bacterium]
MKRPELGEYAESYKGYVDLVTESNGIQALRDSKREALDLWAKWPIAKQDHRYAEGKWTPKEIVQHIIDTERVFGYRALAFGRSDTTELPGFDHNAYVDQSRDIKRSWHDLMEEFEMVRNGSILLFESLESQSTNAGIANGVGISVRALCFVSAGHTRHHLNVLRNKYL